MSINMLFYGPVHFGSDWSWSVSFFFGNDHGSKSLTCENDPCGFVWNLGCLLYTPTCQHAKFIGEKHHQPCFFLDGGFPTFSDNPMSCPQIGSRQSETVRVNGWEHLHQKPGLPEKVRPQQLKLVNLTLQWFYGTFFRYRKTISWLWPRLLHDSHYLGTTFGLWMACQDLGIQARRRLRWWLCTLPETSKTVGFEPPEIGIWGHNYG